MNTEDEEIMSSSGYKKAKEEFKKKPYYLQEKNYGKAFNKGRNIAKDEPC